ncbi:MAG: DUF429 domain-containing protein [Brachybacterium sp.]|uniref:DUF429 domain-containing protein n=1 Tax=Brachybacterium sp. Z12 TaxID=2759167 RepID=UPI0018603604|nr:DUF429 domain-containing protein [Brachybacterium sp. Z12]QNN81936.1 DUF429 domain-containing protein [Brachybacterium sp. Z12]
MSALFVGIDLAAQARSTGMAVLRDDGDRVVVELAMIGAEDEDLLEVLDGARKAGVDVPLGWPRSFVDLLAAHAAGTLPAPESTGGAWRRGLAMRATDLVVHESTGLTPLSVATDRIAHPALRWAGIEARLREQGVDASRDGSGLICEVYPAAALRLWDLPYRGYKGTKNAAARDALLTALDRALPWLDWNGHRALCAAQDDALDAVLAALLAREAHAGRAVAPPSRLRELARQEGWIWLPRSGTVPHAPGSSAG